MFIMSSLLFFNKNYINQFENLKELAYVKQFLERSSYTKSSINNWNNLLDLDILTNLFAN